MTEMICLRECVLALLGLLNPEMMSFDSCLLFLSRGAVRGRPVFIENMIIKE